MSVGLAAALLASGVLGDTSAGAGSYVAGLVALAVGASVCAVAGGAGAVRRRPGGGGRRRRGGAGLRAGRARAPLPGAARAGPGHVGVGCERRARHRRRGVLAALLDFGSGWRPSYWATASSRSCSSGRACGGWGSRRPRSARCGRAGLVLLVARDDAARLGAHPGAQRARRPRPCCSSPALGRAGGVRPRRAPGRPAAARPGAAAAPAASSPPPWASLVLGAGHDRHGVPCPPSCSSASGGLWTATWLLVAWPAPAWSPRCWSAGSASAWRAAPGRVLPGRRRGGPAARARRPPGLVALAAGAAAVVVAGLATGVLNAVLGRESIASVPPDRAAMGSGAQNTARYLGAAFGITLFSALCATPGRVSYRPSWSTAGRSRCSWRARSPCSAPPSSGRSPHIAQLGHDCLGVRPKKRDKRGHLRSGLGRFGALSPFQSVLLA